MLFLQNKLLLCDSRVVSRQNSGHLFSEKLPSIIEIFQSLIEFLRTYMHLLVEVV